MSPAAPATPARIPIMMSIVFPGGGQFTQKRWIVGSFFALATVASLVMSIVQLFRIFVAMMSIADFDAPVRPSPGFAPMLAWLGLTFLLYAAALVDTILAQRRILRRQTAPRMPPPLPQV